MPEIKNNFTGAKMNQDLDERLVPKGEYREANNIDVSSSEEDNVGAVQNAHGNIVKSATAIAGATCIGSYVNKEDNTIIWFIKGDTVDAIAKYNPETDEVTPLLVDKEEVGVDRFLKFLTTGVPAVPACAFLFISLIVFLSFSVLLLTKSNSFAPATANFIETL